MCKALDCQLSGIFYFLPFLVYFIEGLDINSESTRLQVKKSEAQSIDFFPKKKIGASSVMQQNKNKRRKQGKKKISNYKFG